MTPLIGKSPRRHPCCGSAIFAVSSDPAPVSDLKPWWVSFRPISWLHFVIVDELCRRRHDQESVNWVPFFFSNPNDCSMHFPPFAELETKRILLDIFKEKQKKSAEAGTIPSFYKKARETKHRFIIFIFLVYFMHELIALTLITFLYTLLPMVDSWRHRCVLFFFRMGTFTVAFAFSLTVFLYEYVCCSHKSNNTQID